jgi:serine/threonine-protein kinase MRCK
MFSEPQSDPLHILKPIHIASETNGTGLPEAGPQEAQLRKEVAALREQLEQACSIG